MSDGTEEPFAVDKNEDAETSRFQKVQQISTRFPQLLETECVENRRFPQGAGIRLGHSGSVFTI